MDASNLDTAATYINNLLLARGLLRNGAPVDFAKLARGDGPSTDKKERSSSLRTSNTVQVINLVHDLILRRDRDHTHIESLATTLSSSKSDHQHMQQELVRARERNAELARKNNQLEQTDRTARNAMSSLESANRQLREEVQKSKTVLAQVRTQCNNDIRKRDMELQRLKQHLGNQQRGSSGRSTANTGPSCSIVPGSSSRTQLRKRDVVGPNLDEATYSLKQETTEFLTDLSQGLSDENDGLISLIKGTVNTLRDLMGLPHNQSVAAEDAPPAKGWSSDGMLFSPPTSCRDLAQDVQVVLNSLRELLTNPSFAPIEDVQVREEEIQRLRQGWEQMEERWHEAVQMMTSWSRRMQNGGDAVNMAELKMGLQLNEGLRTLEQISPNPMRRAVVDEAEAVDVDDSDNADKAADSDDCDAEQLPAMESPMVMSDEGLLVGRVTERAGARLAPVHSNIQMHRATAPTASSDADEQENSTPMRDSDGEGQMQHATARKTASVVNQVAADSRSGVERERRAAAATRPATGPAELTVHEKLRLVEQEALQASQSSAHERAAAAPLEDRGDRPKRRSKLLVSGRPRRRKSTLSPDELEQLMLGRA